MSKQSVTSAPYLIVIAVLLSIFALTGWAAWRDKSETYDEPLHFMGAWLQTHYDDFRCDPEDPPLWRYYLMVGTSKDLLRVPTTGAIWNSMLEDSEREGAFFKQVFYYTPGNDAVGALREARSRMLLLGVALGAVIAWWAWRLAGPAAAMISAAAFCFDPNFLAHSPLIKGDVPITLALLALMAIVWLVGERATLFRCLLVAAMVGLVLVTKMSGILAIPILGIALGVRAMLPQPWVVWRWSAHTRLRRFAAALAITLVSSLAAWFCIWASYGFRYAPTPDPSLSFNMDGLLAVAEKHQAFAAYHALSLTGEQWRQWQMHWQPTLFLRVLLWINGHHLLPQAWIAGLMFTYGNAASFQGYLLGRSSMTGWWYYFPLAFAFKTPLATLVALAVSVVYWLFVRRQARAWDVIALTVGPAIYLATIIDSPINVGIRHFFPVYPCLFIFLGITFVAAVKRNRKAAIAVGLLFVAGLAAETYAAYPDFIPFFNVAAGGWRNGPNLLGDSNLDWGQELPAIAAWQREHPQYQMYLNYFGSADPRYYGIHYVSLSGSMEPYDESSGHSRPGVFVISGNAFQFPWLNASEKKFYAILKTQKPIAVLGHCIYIYNPPPR